MSGKTTWAKKKAASLKVQGRAIIVLDPLLDPEWNADFITDDQEAFLKVVWSNRNCAVFVDEAGSMVGKYNKTMDELATRGRHWGHKIYFICQRGKMISTTVRTQCSEYVVFKQSTVDVEDLSREAVEPILLEAETLEIGECLHVRHNKPPLRYSVFDM